jgi:hypothetical protein
MSNSLADITDQHRARFQDIGLVMGQAFLY